MPDRVSLRSFRVQVRKNRRRLRRFLSKVEKMPAKKIEVLTQELEPKVWAQVDCLTCANCCKTMTPTFTPGDIKRIAAHLGQTQDAFKEKWLVRERGGARDWINKKQPCQFLNLKDNKCSIYEVRPADCSGFPHLPKKMKDFVHIHKQNVEFCPATYKMVEKMKAHFDRVVAS